MSLSDDEAPEEIALSTGRSQAAALRSQEQAQRTQQSVSKSKRKRKSDDGRLTPGSIQRTGVSVEEQQQQDCVPDDVIAALTAANKAGAETQAHDTADKSQHPVVQPKRRKQQQPSQRTAGPVTVQVLDGSQQTTAPSESAILFAQKQLFGSKRRSIEMLRPCRQWSGKHSNTVRHGGPALQFVKKQA
ncbi:hypothetical protein ABBQ32_005809 [Trebouxia sp. C0010 RCD-2024]